MPSNHKGHPTIAFRPSSSWQYALIDEKAKLSGMNKKDFITRSCIYSNICVIGKKENIRLIIDEVQQMQYVMGDIASQLKAGNVPLSDLELANFKTDVLALCITIVEILDGAAYLFDREPQRKYNTWKQELEIEQFKRLLKLDEMQDK